MRSRAGYTLVEVLISVTFLALLAGTIASMTTLGARSYNSSSVGSHLVLSARRALDRITDELGLADAADLAILPGRPLWDDRVEFDRVSDVDGADGSVSWTRTRIALEYAPGELNDGVDNDGNGLVDDRVVMLTTDLGGPNERRRVLVRNVAEFHERERENALDDNGNGLADERGLCFDRVGNVLTIRLTLQRADGDGRTVSQTLTTAMRMRN